MLLVIVFCMFMAFILGVAVGPQIHAVLKIDPNREYDPLTGNYYSNTRIVRSAPNTQPPPPPKGQGKKSSKRKRK